jgi:type III restriction enzyme
VNERAHRDISNRLSLRTPQREALARLGVLAECLALPTAGADPRAFNSVKAGDRAQQLARCVERVPSLRAFDRDFPSFCFALATGVGKTRLMGAQIAYLHRVHGVRHFFVVAPNLTIYDKLKQDFTPNTPKYVFEGLSEFATTPPELITGDDWDTGRGLRGAGGGLFGQEAVHINLFNVAKFDTADGSRMRRLHETIGSSYFEYLSTLPDLVVLMDESHRYRARAAAGALNDLKPLLGIELTATPQIQEGTRVVSFGNVAYAYPLGAAIRDGFVKKPAVAGRQNLRASEIDPEQLDRMKLEDALVLHERVKTELITYADQQNVKRVKPFVLVIARDTTHAEQLQALISSDSFHKGFYNGRVITVHSNRTGAEKDEVIQRLLRVEDPDEPTEIVIHVEMLKEGWDVTNLYTVVPLRAANSRTLVEQSIGRGLRLPYGRHTGVDAVDRLTIVAHDRFTEIVEEAKRGDSPFAIEEVLLDAPGALTPLVPVTLRPTIEHQFAPPPPATSARPAEGSPPAAAPVPAPAVAGGAPAPAAPQPFYSNPAEQRVAHVAYQVISTLSALPTSERLSDPVQQQAIVTQVRSGLAGAQVEMPIDAPTVDVEKIVAAVTATVRGATIDVPRILLQPSGETTVTYGDAPLSADGLRFVMPEMDLVVQELQSRQRERISVGLPATESRVEDYIIRVLIDEPDLDYEEHADLLYARAGEAVAAIRQYESDETKLHNLVAFYSRDIARKVAAHLRAHRIDVPASYEPVVTHGWAPLSGRTRTVARDEPFTSFREAVTNRSRIRQMRFIGFGRCLFSEVQFESDGERRFAVVLEDDPDTTLRWFRPGRQDIRIFWSADSQYQPDFVVETATEKLLVEIKDPEEVDSAEVQAKKRAAVLWCAHASAHATQHGGKMWRYLLVPDAALNALATLPGLIAQYGTAE